MNSTIKYYNDNAKEYVRQTANVDMSELWSVFEKKLSPGANILDLGCGSGRDAKHFIEKGFIVTATDGSPEICKEASKLIGKPVKCLLFEDLDYENEFDGIWACSSLLHLERSELERLMPKLMHALKAGGIFYTCFKYGDSEFMDDKGRHNTCYTEETIASLTEGLENVQTEVWVTGDNLGGRALQWINILLKKH